MIDFFVKAKKQATDYATTNTGVYNGKLTRKQFAAVLDQTPGNVTKIIRKPDFGSVIRARTPKGKGPVLIPLKSVLDYLEKCYVEV